MVPTCKNCIYCRKMVHNFRVGEGFRHSYACTYLHDTEKGVILETAHDNLACEVFKENEDA